MEDVLSLSLNITPDSGELVRMDYIVNFYYRKMARKKRVFIMNTIFLDITFNKQLNRYIFYFKIPIEGNNIGLQYAYTHIKYLLYFWDRADHNPEFTNSKDCYEQLKQDFENRRLMKSNNIHLEFMKIRKIEKDIVNNL